MELKGRVAVDFLSHVLILANSFNINSDHLQFLNENAGTSWTAVLVFHRKADMVIVAIYHKPELTIEAFEYHVHVKDIDLSGKPDKGETEKSLAGIIYQKIISLEKATRPIRRRMEKENQELLGIIGGRFKKVP